MSQTAAALSLPAPAHTPEDSAPGKFASAVWIHGSEAVHRNCLPGTAFRCWQQVAVSPQVYCLFQPRNTRKGWGGLVCSSFCRTAWIMMPSSLGTFHKMRVYGPCHTARDPLCVLSMQTNESWLYRATPDDTSLCSHSSSHLPLLARAV